MAVQPGSHQDASSLDPVPLIVFDYDYSLINDNSDTWVVKRLSEAIYRDIFGRDAVQRGWTETMDAAMEALHNAGHTIEEIRREAASVPFFPEMRDALRYAATAGAAGECRLVILSDANRIFIEAGLEGMGLADLFDLSAAQGKKLDSSTHSGVILTNDGDEENGRLRVRPFHHNSECPLCPSNLCKGRVLSDLLATRSPENSPIIYIGDGGGDFCAATRLKETDYLLYRSGPKWGLQHRLVKQGKLGVGEVSEDTLESKYPIKCRVVPWSTGEDVFAAFKHILEQE